MNVSVAGAGTPARADGRSARRAVAIWLFACCLLVLAMVVVGGVTRLTHSGLSITEWQPIVGTLPPLSTADWNDAFARYQATPEYRQVNAGMSLAAFKSIFWWEYAHRLLGRAIGIVFALPLLWFALRRRLPPGIGPALVGILLLGGMQGALGWYMVESGLVDDPHVSHLRLTAHLGLALLIFAAMFWLALSLVRGRSTGGPRDSTSQRFAGAAVVLVFVQALAGALVAGLRAGFAYNTFPLMNGHVVPPEAWAMSPWYRNLVDNVAAVQFDHRVIALLLAVLIVSLWWRLRSLREWPPIRLAAHLLLAALVLQLALGIATLLLVVPLPLAAAHQAGAVVLFAAALNVAHALRQNHRASTAPM